MNAIIQSVRETETPYGTAALWWLGQMGLIVKMGKIVLAVDYYATADPARQVAPPIPVDEVEGVDVFLGSHNHRDHIDHDAWRVWAARVPRSRFVFPAAHLQSVLDDGVARDRCVGLTDGQSADVGGVTVRAVAAAHEFLAPDPETGLYPCLQYVIEGNGVRVYHTGDTLRYDGMLQKLRALGTVDAALLPINGRDGKKYRRGCIGNMTMPEAVDLAGELKVRTAIPGHWDMFADNTGDPAGFADYLDAKYPGAAACVIPVRGERIMITA